MRSGMFFVYIAFFLPFFFFLFLFSSVVYFCAFVGKFFEFFLLFFFDFDFESLALVAVYWLI